MEKDRLFLIELFDRNDLEWRKTEISSKWENLFHWYENRAVIWCKEIFTFHSLAVFRVFWVTEGAVLDICMPSVSHENFYSVRRLERDQKQKHQNVKRSTESRWFKTQTSMKTTQMIFIELGVHLCWVHLWKGRSRHIHTPRANFYILSFKLSFQREKWWNLLAISLDSNYKKGFHSFEQLILQF